MAAGPARLFEPAALGPVTLRNRIIKAATFEGMSRGGAVSDALVDFHRAFAAGGAGLTTLAYCAVSPDGRGAPHEIVLGTVDALQLTAGGSLANPMYLFRGDVPRAEFAATLPPLLRPAFRVAGQRLFRAYPFEEAYLRPMARQFRDALRLPLILLGGITRLGTMTQAITDGFAFVALGRALLREPDLPGKLRRQESQESLCIHCNKCVPTIYRGTHCVLVPPADRPGLRLLG